jgi:hypothetical protein
VCFPIGELAVTEWFGVVCVRFVFLWELALTFAENALTFQRGPIC